MVAVNISKLQASLIQNKKFWISSNYILKEQFITFCDILHFGGTLTFDQSQRGFTLK